MLQIADFGLSQLIDPGQRLTKFCGTWAYAAPEMRDRKGGYDCKFDTWSFGVILYVVLCGYHPFDPDGSFPVAEVRRVLPIIVLKPQLGPSVLPVECKTFVIVEQTA